MVRQRLQGKKPTAARHLSSREPRITMVRQSRARKKPTVCAGLLTSRLAYNHGRTASPRRTTRSSVDAVRSVHAPTGRAAHGRPGSAPHAARTSPTGADDVARPAAPAPEENAV